MHTASSAIQPGNVEFTWSIKDFSALQRSQMTVDGHKYYCIDSAPFSPPGNVQPQFYLKLYPYGDTKEYKDYVKIYMCLEEWYEIDIPVKCTLSILKANGEVFKSKDFTKLYAWGSDDFILRAELLNNANEALPGDVLTIRCELDIINEQAVESDSSALMQKLSNECAHDWSSLLSTGEGSDVTLIVDGKEINVHKLVLSTRSAVFKAMFSNDCMEKKEGKVDITDVDLEAFEEFLRFIYTGKVTIGENAFELMVIADKYVTETLKSLCVMNLSSKLTIDTVVPILVKADMHSAPDLKAKAIDFIVSNLANIVQTKNWDAAFESRPMLALEVLRQIGKTSKSPKT